MPNQKEQPQFMGVRVCFLWEIYAPEGPARDEEEERKGRFVQCHKLQWWIHRCHGIL